MDAILLNLINGKCEDFKKDVKERMGKMLSTKRENLHKEVANSYTKKED